MIIIIAEIKTLIKYFILKQFIVFFNFINSSSDLLNQQIHFRMGTPNCSVKKNWEFLPYFLCNHIF